MLFLGIFISGLLTPFSAVFAQDLTNGMGEFQSQTQLGGVDLITVIGRIVNIFLSFLGLIGVILVIYAGFIWMTSGGNPEQISKAKKLMTAALVGLLIIIMSFAIVNFILKLFGGIAGTSIQPTSCLATNTCPQDYYLPPDAFKAKKILTTHSNTSKETYYRNVYLCSAVQPIFNRGLNAQRITQLASSTFLKVQNENIPGEGGIVNGKWQARSNVTIFKHPGILFATNTMYRTVLPKDTEATTPEREGILSTADEALKGCYGSSATGNGCIELNDATNSRFMWRFETGEESDTVNPFIISTYPGVNMSATSSSPPYSTLFVSRKPVLEIYFSEPIDPTTVLDENDNFIADNIWIEKLATQGGAVVETVSSTFWSTEFSETGFNFTPTSSELLEPFTWYRVHIRNIADLCSNAMSGEYVFEFQTNDKAPGFASVYPVGTNSCPSSNIYARFVTPMYRSKITFKIEEGKNIIVADIRPSEFFSASTTWQKNIYTTSTGDALLLGVLSIEDVPLANEPIDNNVRTFKFDPVELQSNTAYTVTVTTDLKINRRGDLLQRTWQFTTGKTETCQCGPYISNVGPSEGKKGECLTVRGECFAGSPYNRAQPIDIHFVKTNATSSSSSVPLGGYDEYYGSYLTTIAPTSSLFFSGDYLNAQVTTRYNDQASTTLMSNEEEFYINNPDIATGPCIFSTRPTSGYRTNPVFISGTRFGSATGTVRFDMSVAPINLWTESKIKSFVPTGALSGSNNVYATNTIGSSNRVPFAVFDEYCGCSSDNSCPVPGQADINQYGCRLNQSPACCTTRPVFEQTTPCLGADGKVGANAGFGGVFKQSEGSATTIPMDASSVRENVKFEKCIGPAGNECSKTASVASRIVFRRDGNNKIIGLSIFPSSCLLDNQTKYKLTLKGGIDGSGIKTLSGVSFRASTGDTAEYVYEIGNNLCQVQNVCVEPSFAQTPKTLSQGYTALAYAQPSCGNGLVCVAEYNWTALDESLLEKSPVAYVTPTPELETSVFGVNLGTSTISAETQGIIGNGKLAVVPSPLFVIESTACKPTETPQQYPSPSPSYGTEDSCVNVKPNLRFNKVLNTSTVQLGNTVVLEKCLDKKCAFRRTVPSSLDIIAFNTSSDKIIFNPNGDLLEPGTKYRVTIKSGDSGVRALDFGKLEEEYIWMFNTKNVPLGNVMKEPKDTKILVVEKGYRYAGYDHAQPWIDRLRQEGYQVIDNVSVNTIADVDAIKPDIVAGIMTFWGLAKANLFNQLYAKGYPIFTEGNDNYTPLTPIVSAVSISSIMGPVLSQKNHPIAEGWDSLQNIDGMLYSLPTGWGGCETPLDGQCSASKEQKYSGAQSIKLESRSGDVWIGNSGGGFTIDRSKAYTIRVKVYIASSSASGYVALWFQQTNPWDTFVRTDADVSKKRQWQTLEMRYAGGGTGIVPARIALGVYGAGKIVYFDDVEWIDESTGQNIAQNTSFENVPNGDGRYGITAIHPKAFGVAKDIDNNTYEAIYLEELYKGRWFHFQPAYVPSDFTLLRKGFDYLTRAIEKSALCPVAYTEVNPNDFDLRVASTTDYRANALDAQCRALSGTYTYEWQSSKPNVASILPLRSESATIATGVSQDRVKISAITEGKTGTGDLFVYTPLALYQNNVCAPTSTQPSYPSPNPNPSISAKDVCINTKISAVLTKKIDKNTVSQDTFKVERCENTATTTLQTFTMASPGFESGTSNWWVINSNCMSLSAVNEGPPHSGDNSGKIEIKKSLVDGTDCGSGWGGTNYNHHYGIAQTVSLGEPIAGKNLVGSIWVKAPPGREVALLMQSQRWDAGYIVANTITTNGMWQKISVPWKPSSLLDTSSAIHFRLSYQQQGNPGDVFYWDDARLEEISFSGEQCAPANGSYKVRSFDTARDKITFTPEAPNTVFKYRVPIQIKSENTSTLPNFQISFPLDTKSLIAQGKMKSDCGDLRVADASGAIIDYAFDPEKGCNLPNTKIWAKVPSLAKGDSTLYALYGNTYFSNGAKIPQAIFDIYDDFSNIFLDYSYWNFYPGSADSYSLTERPGWFRIKVNGISNTWCDAAQNKCYNEAPFLYRALTRSTNYIIETKEDAIGVGGTSRQQGLVLIQGVRDSNPSSFDNKGYFGAYEYGNSLGFARDSSDVSPLCTLPVGNTTHYTRYRHDSSNRIFYEYSLNGDIWTTCGSYNALAIPDYWGLLARSWSGGGTGFNADFDYFLVRKNSDATITVAVSPEIAGNFTIPSLQITDPPLLPNSTYKITLPKGGIKGRDGISLESNAQWYFSTANNANLCDPSFVAVYPGNKTMEKRGEEETYSSEALDGMCRELIGSYLFNWSTPRTELMTINPTTSEETTLITGLDFGTTTVDSLLNTAKGALIGKGSLSIMEPLRVIEDGSCNLAIDPQLWPSPSPLHNTRNLCINISPYIRLNKKLISASVNPLTTLIKQCDEAGNCVAVSGWSITVEPYSTTSDMISFMPTGGLLNTSTYYQITLKGGGNGIQALDTSRMKYDYIWNFSTRATNDFCTMSAVGLSPTNYELDLLATTTYSGSPLDAECKRLTGETYDYEWFTSQPNIAYPLPNFTVGWAPQGIGTTTVIGTSTGKTTITAQTRGKKGNGSLRVKLSPLEVLQSPACTPTATPPSYPSPNPYNNANDVCTNIKIGVAFNKMIDKTTISTSSFAIRKAGGSTVNGVYNAYKSENQSVIIFTPNTIKLATSSEYVITIKGMSSPTPLRATDGTALKNNFTYSFYTTSSDALCEPSYVMVTPPSATVVGTNVNKNYSADAIDTRCQILNGAFDYDWSSGSTSVATINPSTSTGETIMTSQGIGATIINASTLSANGFGNIMVKPLPLSIVESTQCNLPDERPSPSPKRNDKDVCVNIAPYVRFNKKVDPSTVTNTTVQLKKCLDAECASMMNVSQSLSVQDYGGYADRVIVTPNGFFSTSANYYLIVKGGINGVKAQDAAIMDSDYITKFTTRASNESCPVSYVGVDPFNATMSTGESRNDFTASPYDNQCRQLIGTFDYEWNSENRAIVVAFPTSTIGLAPAGTATTTVTASSTGATRVSAQTRGKTGFSAVQVKLPPLQLVTSTMCLPTATPPSYPSPNPSTAIPSGAVCTNIKVSALFNKRVDFSSLSTTSFSLQRAGGLALAGNYQIYPYDDMQDTIVFTPNLLPLAINTDYTVKIATSVRAYDGTMLAQPYAYSFHTTSSNVPCEPSYVMVSPVSATFTTIPESKRYYANAVEAQCQLLSGSFDYNWSSGSTSIAIVSPASSFGDALATSQGIGTTNIYAQTRSANGFGVATVQPLPLEVIESDRCDISGSQYPSPNPRKSQQNVCLNSKIIVRLNKKLNNATVNVTTVSLKDGNGLSQQISTVVLPYTSANDAIQITPSSNFLTNKTYTITLKGGSSGIKGMDTSEMTNSYTYQFTTGALQCAMSDIAVLPNPYSMYAIPTTTPYSALPIAPDCQIISTTTLTYLWNSSTSSVATTSVSITDTNTVISQGIGYTNISANVQGKTGSAHLLIDPYPTLVSIRPVNNQLNVCRNGAVEVIFDQRMDPATINIDNFIVKALVPDTLIAQLPFMPSRNGFSETYFAKMNQQFKKSFKKIIGSVKELFETVLQRNENLLRGAPYDFIIAATTTKDALVTELHLDESVGATSFKDSAGNNDASCFSGSCPTAGVTGKASTAVQFNGLNNYLTIAASSSLNFTGAHSYDMWIKVTNYGGSGVSRIIGRDGFSFELSIGTISGDGGIPVGNIGMYTPSLGWKNTGFRFERDIWYRLKMLFDGSRWNLYVDDVLRWTSAITSVNANGQIALGAKASGGENFNGIIDEFKIEQPKSVGVSMTAIPSNGFIPFINVDLAATVSGTATGPITYQFDCTNDGVYEFTTTTSTLSYTATDLCNYTATGISTASVSVTRQGIVAKETTVITVNNAPPTLSVALVATPSSGTELLNDVDLKATVSGSATGPITYQFDCTNDGINEHSMSTTTNPYSAIDICDYSTNGIYTAKVEVSREGISNSATTTIVVKPTTYRWIDIPGIIKTYTNVSNQTVAFFNPLTILPASTTHTAIISFNANGPKTQYGIAAQQVTTSIITFKTRDEICNLDTVRVEPNIYTFKTASAKNNFTALGYSDDGQILNKLPGVYDWQYQWNAVDNSLYEVPAVTTSTNTITAKDKQGGTFLTATASSTTGWFGTISGSAMLDNFFCNNVWEYNDNSFYSKYRLRYCRDKGIANNTSDDLPALTGPLKGLVSGKGQLANILFAVDESNMIGAQIFENYDRMRPLAWYQSKAPNPVGTPVPATIDGYEAIKDNRTTYVSVPNLENGRIKTNIYLMSRNDGASPATLEIYDQLSKYWKFNMNLADIANEQPKLQRDLQRMYSFPSMIDSLAQHKNSKGIYPKLESGSYYPGISMSRWPSWQTNLGAELGISAIRDPVNQFGDAFCASSGEDQWGGTCYNPREFTYQCPSDSLIHQYSSLDNGSKYGLYGNMEYKPISLWQQTCDSLTTESSCNANSWCAWSTGMSSCEVKTVDYPKGHNPCGAKVNPIFLESCEVGYTGSGDRSANGICSSSQIQKRSGKYSLHFASNNAWIWGSQYYTSLVPGDTITIGAWIYLEEYYGGSPLMALQRTNIWDHLVEKYIDTTKLGVWQYITTTYKSAVTAPVRLKFQISSPRMVLYIDDVEVKKNGIIISRGGDMETLTATSSISTQAFCGCFNTEIQPEPAFDFSIDKESISFAESAKLSWNAVGFDSCAASSKNYSSWNGNKDINGGEFVVSTMTPGTYEFELQCVKGDRTLSRRQTVAIIDLPVIAFNASTLFTSANKPVTLSWDVVNADECRALSNTPEWKGKVSLKGFKTFDIATTDEFILECSNSIGKRQKKLMISVAPPPTLSFETSATTVNTGDYILLTWSAQQADNCFASSVSSPYWNGYLGTNGALGTYVGNSPGVLRYDLTCSGPGGAVAQSINITVAQPSFIFKAAPNTGLVPGQYSYIVWNASTTAASCSATNINAPFWTDANINGAKSGNIVGQFSINPSTLQLKCGSDPQKSIDINVNGSGFNFSGTALGLPWLNYDEYAVLSWIDQNGANACSATDGLSGWFGSKPTSGIAIYTLPVMSPTTFNLTCGGVAKSVNFNLGGTAQLNFWATANPIGEGQNTTLKWTSTNVEKCVGYSPTYSGWNVPLPANSTGFSIGPLSATTDFSLRCVSASNEAIQRDLQIVVYSGTKISLSANPSAIAVGENSLLSWDSKNITGGCFTSSNPNYAPWNTVTTTSGTMTVALNETTNFMLTCNPSAPLTQSVTVQVVTNAPTLEFVAFPNTINRGEVSTLYWDTRNVQSCNANGAWTGVKPSSGSINVNPTSTSVYGLTCSGPTGIINASTTVTVQ
ncbi:MAG: DUF2341 domain-containing protein [Parcubacteria group bacterium]|nr:DUF2341 domain-containing protein [Parcubacteria group bacterium]